MGLRFDQRLSLLLVCTCVCAPQVLSYLQQVSDARPKATTPPVTRDDIFQAAKQISERLLDKYGTMVSILQDSNPRRCSCISCCSLLTGAALDSNPAQFQSFRAIDENSSGSISREELERSLDFLNLEGVATRKEVIFEFMQTIDSDGNNELDFKEFTRAMACKPHTH